MERDRSPVRVTATGDCIAMVYLTDPATKRRDDVHAGNARLICAAPELLALVRHIWERFDADLALGDPQLPAQVKALLKHIDGL